MEVRKDEETNEYKIFRSDEVVYDDSYNSEITDQYNNQSTMVMREEEEQIYDKSNVKRRILRKDNNRYNSAAFSKIGFLILNIIVFIMSVYFIIIFK